MKHLSSYFAIINKNVLFIFIIVLVIYCISLTPGLKAANDLPYSSESFIAQLLTFPTAWNPYGGVFGQSQLSTLWAWPSNLLYAFGALLGLSFGLMVSLIGILPIILIGFWGMYHYLRFLIHSQTARGVGALFYLINTYILLVIDGGQLLWGLAYALIPWCLFLLEKSLVRRQISLITILPVLILSFTDFRALYILSILVLVRLGYEFIYLPRREYLSWIKLFSRYGVLVVSFLLGLHAYWWLPLLLSQSSLSPSNLVVSTNVDFLKFTTLRHAILLLQPHWYLNIFGNITPIRIEFLPLLPLALLAIFQYSKRVGYWLILLIIGAFLSKGTNPPIGESYIWMLEKVPGFFLFRDPTKFFIFTSFAYAVLISSAFEFLEKKKFGRFDTRIVLPFLIVVYLIMIIWPVYTNQMTGLLGFAKQTDEYQSIQQKLQESSNSGRVLWIPSKKPLGFMDEDNLAINGTDLVSMRPFATGIKGTYETLNFLREASYSGELLAIAGIKNVVYSPMDPRKSYKDDERDYYWLFLQQLSGRDWLSPSTAQETVFDVKDPMPIFFIPENFYFVIGSDQIYQESTKSAVLSLRNNGLLFVEEKPELFKNQIEQGQIMMYEKDKLDLVMQQVDDATKYFPAENLSHSPDSSGWWKRETLDFLSFKDFLIQKYEISNQDFDLGGGWSIAEGNTTKEFNLSAKSGDYILLRALESTRSGELIVESDNGLNQKVDLKKDGDNVKWHNFGQVKSDFSRLKIITLGDISLINALAIVPEQEFENAQLIVNNLNTKTGFAIYEKNNQQPNITYQKLNNDQYRLKVSNITKPSLVVFNQQYDSKWDLNGKPSLPVYSLFNGFIINQNGEYLLEYTPHRYMFWSGIISFGSLLILAGSVVYIYYGKKVKKLV